MPPSIRTLAFLLSVVSMVAAARAAVADPLETPLPAQNGPVHAGTALGLSLHRLQDDFALGALVSSPAFFRRMVRVSVGGGVAWYPHALGSDGREDWERFFHGRLGIEVGPPVSGTTVVRPYGFAGVQAVFVPEALSDRAVGFGPMGGFGLEFTLPNAGAEQASLAPVTFFVELGGMGNAKRAERLPTRPLLANGFVATVGFRVYP